MEPIQQKRGSIKKYNIKSEHIGNNSSMSLLTYGKPAHSLD
jgi:hypothetical protein